MRYIINKILFIVVLVSLPVSFIYGREYNARNILIGSKAAMLGGAYTSLSEDLSGCYYNPGGIAFVKNPLLSIDGTVYSYSIMNEQGRITIPDIDSSNILRYKYNTNTYLGTPNLLSMGFTFAQRCAFAFSFITTDFSKSADSMRYYTIADGDIAQTLEKEIYEYRNDLIGPTFGIKLSDTIGFGVSVFYQTASYKEDYTSFIKSFANEYASLTAESAIFNGGGLILAAGIKCNITEELKIGLLYSSATFHLHGKEKSTYSDISYEYNETTGVYEPAAYLEFVKNSGFYRFPHRLAFGIAYDMHEKFLITADVICYLPLSYGKKYGFYAPNRMKEAFHYDLSLGTELFLTKIISLRLGFFTNTSSAVEKVDRYNIYGGTAGIGIYRAGGLSTGIGMSASYGQQKGTYRYLDKASLGPSIWQLNKKQLNISMLIGASKEF